MHLRAASALPGVDAGLEDDVDLHPGGQVVGEVTVGERGPFAIEVSVPRAALRGAELVLRAQRGFVPADCGLGADPRLLAFRLPDFATP